MAQHTIRGLTATGRVAAVDLAWEPLPWEPLVDHYAVYAARGRAPEPGPRTLLAKTLYPHFTHAVLGPEAVTWHYKVVAVVASGERGRPAAASATTEPSYAIGEPLVAVGSFDHQGLEFALSPNGSSRYLATFPAGVDYRYGTSRPENDWPYLHPGPADSWAGRRAHTFTLRFALDAPPTADPGFALWLTDSHATIPGKARLAVNGTEITVIEFARGATKGSLEGDATRPGTPLKPSFVELPLPAGAFTAGENTLTLAKTEGSWHAYDAIGVFAAR
ncbi:polysaccharide lyase family protein [Streptomyces litchfieldiae]|uniref:Polysaccharide lyase family protein n=1 Tax=Streptomyces litchfieldiae TaxID=3075543 RepID=A0ABU2MK30_9ACTN|nr:polysaccharide lyase family protein [Streptomyces sp. DSM 44938]MDT0341836.1 polysaccharide lyase family protein [Streptomyces sp. DSM 44938]